MPIVQSGGIIVGAQLILSAGSISSSIAQGTVEMPTLRSASAKRKIRQASMVRNGSSCRFCGPYDRILGSSLLIHWHHGSRHLLDCSHNTINNSIQLFLVEVRSSGESRR